MENNDENVYQEIREILEKNKDAQKGFSKAAENSEHPKLKAYFLKKSGDREKFNQKLISEIHTGYPKMDVDGSFAGSIHRVWMDVKLLLSSDNDEAILEEAIRGDKAAIAEYDEVLDYKTLPVGIRHLLSEQRVMIQTDVRNNSTLEDLE
jgi:uncharacterized protein (TIGR02284 family)